MAVAQTATGRAETNAPTPTAPETPSISSDKSALEAEATAREQERIARGEEIRIRMAQMAGADKVGGLAIGIVVVGIVLNEMNSLDLIGNSSGVIDVQGILQTAGSGLGLLALAIIALAASVVLGVFRSGF